MENQKMDKKLMAKLQNVKPGRKIKIGERIIMCKETSPDMNDSPCINCCFRHSRPDCIRCCISVFREDKKSVFYTIEGKEVLTMGCKTGKIKK